MENVNLQKQNQSFDRDPIKKFSENKKIWISIGIALLLLITIWIWKSMQINNIKNKSESDYKALKEQSIKEIIAAKQEQLKLLAKPYVWAVRTEMMAGNINQINQYALDMVKEKNIMLIAIANDSGIIISSTNKKDEGKSFTSIGIAAVLNINETMVQNTNDSVLTVTSPVMGFNKRLGTLFIKFAIQLPELN